MIATTRAVGRCKPAMMKRFVVAILLTSAAPALAKSGPSSIAQMENNSEPEQREAAAAAVRTLRHDGWYVAPMFKSTRMLGQTAEMAGVRGGWVFDGRVALRIAGGGGPPPPPPPHNVVGVCGPPRRGGGGAGVRGVCSQQ